MTLGVGEDGFVEMPLSELASHMGTEFVQGTSQVGTLGSLYGPPDYASGGDTSGNCATTYATAALVSLAPCVTSPSYIPLPGQGGISTRDLARLAVTVSWSDFSHNPCNPSAVGTTDPAPAAYRQDASGAWVPWTEGAFILVSAEDDDDDALGPLTVWTYVYRRANVPGAALKGLPSPIKFVCGFRPFLASSPGCNCHAYAGGQAQRVITSSDVCP